MSKAAKQSIFILILLLAGGLGFAGFTLLEKQKIEQQKISIERELQASQAREKSTLVEMKWLKDQIAQEAGEKSKFKDTIDGLQKRVEELLVQISQLTGERDKGQSRLEEIKKERNELLAKLQEKPQVVYQEKIVYKDREPEPSSPPVSMPEPEDGGASDNPAQVSAGMPDDAAPAASSPREPDGRNAQNANEEYVAQLLKEKTALEVEIEKFKADLSQRSLEIVDLKQANENLRLDLDAIRQEKQNIADSIREKEDMVNRLSLELARAKNEQQFVAQKVDQLTQKNMRLHQDIKKLSEVKMALERSIVQITQEKDGMSRKLDQAEAVLENKIGEIWEVKDSLDRSFNAVKAKSQSANEVELPPIIVSARGAGTDVHADSQARNPGFEGKIMSVNEQNHFVIVDIGEKRGLRTGDALGVYRGSDYVARLEVIQVRPDIAAADLKEQRSKVKIGDTVR